MLAVKAINIQTFLIAVLLLILFIIAALSFPFGLLLIVAVILTLIYTRQFVPLMIFLSLLLFWQNTWIGFSSDIIDERSDFNLLHGLNFIVPLLFFFFIFAIRRKLPSVFFNAWIWNLLVIFILITATIVGGILYGFTYSIGYLRLFLGPLLLFWIGFWIATKTENTDLDSLIHKVFWVSFCITVIQFIFPQLIIIALNDTAYYGWKVQTENVEEVVNYLNSNAYLNLPIGIQLARAGGLVKSFISNAYFLTILATLVYWRKSKVITWLLVAAISLCCGSKGALLLFLLFNAFTFLRRTFSFNIVFMFFALLWTTIVSVGHVIRNEHIVGFISGLGYIDSVGNGLGFGGNLSPIRLKSWHGLPLDDLGYWTRFQNGSESALGVLFSSIGFLSLVYIAYAFYIIYVSKRILVRTDEYIAIVALLMIMQGIFQEEAYSPFALGLSLFYLGFKASANCRAIEDQEAITSMSYLKSRNKT